VNNNEDKFFTIMIVPHSGKSSFSISIPSIAFKVVGGVLAGLCVFASIFTIYFSQSYNKVKTAAKELTIKSKNYEDEYKELQEQLKFFVEKTHILEQKMNSIEKLDNDLRHLLEDEPSFKGNSNSGTSIVGGKRGILASRGSVDRERVVLMSLEEKMPEQEQSLMELKDAIVQRSERIACTPNIKPTTGTITSNFGYRRSPFGSRREFHDGVDIAAPYGTDIVATADGMVTFAGYKSGYGNTVTIDHGYGFQTSYCHNSKNVVKAGQKVKKGKVIAKVGSSGRSTGPHVHYMIYVNGALKNPKDYF